MSLTMLGDFTLRPDRRRGACALIAIKARPSCKMRLSESLAQPARIELVRSMLRSVLAAVEAAQLVSQTIVVSPERDCVPAEIPVLADSGESLNGALLQAHEVLRKFGCREVVILPADLPTITAAEVDGLVRAGRSGGFAIAPDTVGVGTNALCLVSPHPFRFQFGLNSYRLHLEEARRAGLSQQIVRLPGLEFDIDSPADLNRLKELRCLPRLLA